MAAQRIMVSKPTTTLKETFRVEEGISEEGRLFDGAGPIH
jgi:hypothetical protein